MTLCDFFDQCFETIFTEAHFSEIDKKQMKTSLTLIWLKRVGDQITPLLGQEEVIVIEQLMTKSTSPTTPHDPNLAQKISHFMQNAARNQQVIDIFFKEAEKLLTHIASVFSVHATPDQVASLKTKMRTLSTKLTPPT